MDSLPKTPNGKIDYKKLTGWVKKPDAEVAPEKQIRWIKNAMKLRWLGKGRIKEHGIKAPDKL